MHTTNGTPSNPHEPASCQCAHDPDVRILRRVSALDDFPLAATRTGAIRTVAVLDCETTGTDPLNDEIIDLAVVIIEVDEKGEVVGIARSGQALRDPGIPIPPAITMITGITDADVAGKSIDLDKLERLLGRADVRLAHNASFDLSFVQHLMPGLVGAAWACSIHDFDWLRAGFDGAKLGHLLMQTGRFNAGHRAMADVISLLHLLAHRLDDGSTVIGTILANAQRMSIRLEAAGAPYDKRSALKGRGYRWDPAIKTWWIEIEEDEFEDEQLWLQREIVPWGPTPWVRPITWHERHR